MSEKIVYNLKDSIFKNKAKGDAFNIEKDLGDIRKKYHGQEGLEKIQELKESWRFQKKGLAEIQAKALEEINNLDKDFSATMFLKESNDLFDKYLLNDDARLKIERTLKICEDRIYRIKSLQEKSRDKEGKIDDKKLFKLVFRFSPQGEIKCIIKPLYIYFKMDNEEDYAVVFSGSYLKNKKPAPDDFNRCKAYAGSKLEKSFFPELRGGILVESPSCFFDDDFSKKILIHEERHVLNDLIFKNSLSDGVLALKLIKKLEENQEEKQLDLIQNSSIEMFAKDEISAYFQERHSGKFISNTLLRDETIYDYAYYYNYSETDGEEIHKDYYKIVQGGIVAFAKMLDSGMDISSVQGILMTEPLASWPKVSERMIGGKIKDEDFKKNISKKIRKRYRDL